MHEEFAVDTNKQPAVFILILNFCVQLISFVVEHEALEDADENYSEMVTNALITKT